MSKKYSQLPTAATLDGSEITAIVQDGSSKKVTLQEIADLGSGGGGSNHFRDEWDPTGDVFPVDADAWGSGTAGALVKGDYGFITADAFLESIDGTPGGDTWNAYAQIIYWGSGTWLIKA